MSNYLFTSESVSRGHPDKVADQVSDAILDACLAEDSHSRVAVETLLAKGLIVISGEVTTKAKVDYKAVAKRVIQEIGYQDIGVGFDATECHYFISISEQSPDIAQGVNLGEGLDQNLGAGDQGIMFGFACDETPELMPLPIMLANRLMGALRDRYETKEIPYLGPDAKAQVTVEYTSPFTPVRIHTIVLSTQHEEGVDHAQVEKDIKGLAKEMVPFDLLDTGTRFLINPTGRFVIGGPAGDCGLTGRKIIVDTYGGMGRHGGGAFSGKDATKVDRSASYAARYVAKNIVAAKLAKRCEIQLSYAIGVSYPISIKVDTFGTSDVPESILEEVIFELFDLSPSGIIKMLDLRRPIYEKTAYFGHFGRRDLNFTWEATDRVKALQAAVEERAEGAF